jgi:hypothetical protein
MTGLSKMKRPELITAAEEHLASYNTDHRFEACVDACRGANTDGGFAGCQHLNMEKTTDFPILGFKY